MNILTCQCGFEPLYPIYRFDLYFFRIDKLKLVDKCQRKTTLSCQTLRLPVVILLNIFLRMPQVYENRSGL